MLSLKSEAVEDSVSLTSPEVSVAQELQFWQTFVFDMDREQHSKSRNPRDPRDPQRSRSTSTSTSNTTGQHSHMHAGGSSKLYAFSFVCSRVRTSSPVGAQDAALLAQFAAATGGDLNQAYSNMMSQNPYPSMSPTPGFYGNFLHHGPMPTQLPPLSSLDFPWHNLPQQPQASSSHYDPRQQNPSTSIPPLPPYIDTQFSSSGSRSGNANRESKRGKASSSSTANEGHTTSSPEVEQTEAERNSIADEKRRRNTAASGRRINRHVSQERSVNRSINIVARFRVKKKHKTIGLERSVSDLTGRAEELEREAADLRRENGWLKEIVMLKGTRFAANNAAHREALTQAAALATGSYTDMAREGASGSGVGSSLPEDISESGSSESESSDAEEKKSKKKGKGKKATKKE
ncbi:hypothetical protein CVT25_013999 [Psilocybe cyanescens]|uniref:BZIP domain-containing protein n=1 Tax=Psilocybe cyanescens TaxID=93625 RepID=A0A409XPI8_PSICY|nr:hypothetical protein CVT25_013999 [Psilocybe cyanescens]